MFDENYTKLELEEIALLLDVVNKRVEGSVFDPVETTILEIDIPFYPGYRFLDIADHATKPPLQRYVVQNKDDGDFRFIDWRHETIYDLNDQASFDLDDETVLEYVRFFFAHVKGRFGRFMICESVHHVQWKDEPPMQVRQKLNEILQPLTIKEKKDDGVYVIRAFMMLGDALYDVDVYVAPNGRVTMSDHEILVQDIPVLDSVFGQ